LLGWVTICRHNRCLPPTSWRAAGRDRGIDLLRAWRDKIVSVQEDADCRGGCPLGLLGSEFAELDHVAWDDVAAGCRRWRGAIRACLRGMRDRGQLVPPADPGRLAMAMLAALQGGLLLAQIEGFCQVLDGRWQRARSGSGSPLRRPTASASSRPDIWSSR